MEKELLKKIEDVITIGKELHNRGLVAAFDGNISFRYDDRIVVTAMRTSKGRLTQEDFVILDLEGNILPGQTRKPSSETPMHVEIYRHRKDVGAVVHAHPPHCIALSMAGIHLMDMDLPEVLIQIGEVVMLDYAVTGTDEVFGKMKPHIHNDAFILAYHGAVTLGEDLWEAYYKMEQVEHAAKVLYLARQLGEIKPLPPEAKQGIAELRIKYNAVKNQNGNKG